MSLFKKQQSYPIVTPIHEEVAEEIAQEEKKAWPLLGMDESAAPKEVVTTIMDKVDEILAGNYGADEIKDFAIALGCLWGRMVVRQYGWEYRDIVFDKDSDALQCLVSPQEFFCCNPISFVYGILTGNNTGLDGKNDNTILLLFNMLDGIDQQNRPYNTVPTKTSKKYQYLH